MDCPTCQADIDVEREYILESHEDGVEINIACPSCGDEFYCILKPELFTRVDD